MPLALNTKGFKIFITTLGKSTYMEGYLYSYIKNFVSAYVPQSSTYILT